MPPRSQAVWHAPPGEWRTPCQMALWIGSRPIRSRLFMQKCRGDSRCPKNGIVLGKKLRRRASIAYVQPLERPREVDVAEPLLLIFVFAHAVSVVDDHIVELEALAHPFGYEIKAQLAISLRPGVPVYDAGVPQQSIPAAPSAYPNDRFAPAGCGELPQQLDDPFFISILNGFVCLVQQPPC